MVRFSDDPSKKGVAVLLMIVGGISFLGGLFFMTLQFQDKDSEGDRIKPAVEQPINKEKSN